MVAPDLPSPLSMMVRKVEIAAIDPDFILEDQNLLSTWQDYHACLAKLRLLSKVGNFNWPKPWLRGATSACGCAALLGEQTASDGT